MLFDSSSDEETKVPARSSNQQQQQQQRQPLPAQQTNQFQVEGVVFDPDRPPLCASDIRKMQNQKKSKSKKTPEEIAALRAEYERKQKLKQENSSMRGQKVTKETKKQHLKEKRQNKRQGGESSGNNQGNKQQRGKKSNYKQNNNQHANNPETDLFGDDEDHQPIKTQVNNFVREDSPETNNNTQDQQQETNQKSSRSGGNNKKNKHISENDMAFLQEIFEDPNFHPFIQSFLDKQEEADQLGVTQFEMVEEDDDGPIEYKLKLASPTYDRVEHLTTQMLFRLGEGNGEAFYHLGVNDDGDIQGLCRDEMIETMSVLFFMSRNLNAEIEVVKVRIGREGHAVEVKVTRPQIDGIKPDIKIVLLGAENSGKSTLVGVLTSGELDDGEGTQRTKVFRHKHELEQGKTSSISQQILGFYSNGKVTNRSRFQLSWHQIVESSSKIITFIDVAGNEKYFKTMIKGVSSYYPDYAILVVDAKAGLTSVALDHLRLGFSQEKPVIVLLTKMDMVTADELFLTLEDLRQHVKTICDKRTLVVKTEDQVMLMSRTFQEEDIVPVCCVSNTTGEGINTILDFLNLLPINTSRWNHNKDQGAEFHVAEKQFLPSGELILSGIMLKGAFSVRQLVFMGPDSKGRFRKVEIQEIQAKKIPVRQIKAGQICSMHVNLGKYAESWIKDGEVREGMVLLDTKMNPKATYTFRAEIWAFDSVPRKIKNSHQPVVHSSHIRQCCAIVLDENQEKIMQQQNSTASKQAAHHNSIVQSFSNYDKNSCPSTTSDQPEENKQQQQQQSSSPFDFKNTLAANTTSQQQNTPPRDQNGKSQTYNKQKRLRSVSDCEALELNHVDEELRTADAANNRVQEIEIHSKQKTKVIMQFLYNPEYINIGNHIIISENQLKVFGRVTDVFYDINEKFYCKNLLSRPRTGSLSSNKIKNEHRKKRSQSTRGDKRTLSKTNVINPTIPEFDSTFQELENIRSLNKCSTQRQQI